MGKKCVQCGHTLPDDASFCPHCTAVQTEKQEIKTPRRWKRTALTVLGIAILIAIIGMAISMYHRPKVYEGGAKIDYVEMVDFNQLETLEKVQKPLLRAMAVYIGKTRLIDNFIME